MFSYIRSIIGKTQEYLYENYSFVERAFKHDLAKRKGTAADGRQSAAVWRKEITVGC